MGKTRQASKPLFFAVIAIALIAAGIAGVFAFGLDNSNPWYPTPDASFTVTMAAQLLEDGVKVSEYDPTERQSPFAFLDRFAIVFEGSPLTTRDDITLDPSSHTYAVEWIPRIDLTASDINGTNAQIVVTVTSASYQWKGGAAYPVSLKIGASDSATDSWAANSSAHSKSFTLGNRLTGLEVVFNDPPASGASGELRMRFLLKADLYVDGGIVDTVTAEINGIARFSNSQPQASGTLSIAMVTLSSTLQTYELGTP